MTIDTAVWLDRVNGRPLLRDRHRFVGGDRESKTTILRQTERDKRNVKSLENILRKWSTADREGASHGKRNGWTVRHTGHEC